MADRIEETDTKITIRMGASVMTVPRAKVASIERSEAPHDVYARKAAALAEDDLDGHVALGRYAVEHRLYKEAIAQFRQALALKPEHAEALRLLRQRIDPHAATLITRARAIQRRREHAQAETPLTQLLEIYPESTHAATAHHLLAVGYAARGEHDQALVRWRRALNLRPDYAEASEGAAQACIDTNDWPEAIRFTEQAAATRGETPEGARLEARVKALRELQELSEQADDAPGRSTRLAREGRLLMDLGLADRGVERIEAAYDAGARDPKLLAFLAEHHERKGRVRLALEIVEAMAKVAPTSAELARRRERLSRLLLIPKALATRDRRARERILFDIERSGASFAYVEAALRESTVREPQKTGLVEGSFMVDELLRRSSYACYVPNGYDPRRPWPLIIALHRDDDSGKEHFYNWESVAKSEKYIILCPTAPRNGSWRFSDLPLPLSALRHATKLYNIDTDRVFAAGTGGGGLLAWAVALRHPDRFAALIVRNTRLDEVSRLYLATANNLAIYQLVNERAPADMIGSLREAAGALSRWHYNARREEVPGYRHPAMPELNDKVAGWLADKARKPYPRAVKLVSFQHENAECHWIRIDRFTADIFDPDRKVTATGPVGVQLTEEQIRAMYMGKMQREIGSVVGVVSQGNRIHIQTRQVAELTVMLSDRLVDLDKPVAISLNGKLVFRNRVRRSLITLFESARRRGDPRLCHSAAIPLKVP